MKTNPFRLVLLAAVMGLTAVVARAGSTPVWTATIPAPSFSSISSGVHAIVSDTPSSTLAVLYHYDFMFNAVGTQLVLIGAHGQVLAARDFPAMDPATFVSFTPLSVTPRKLILESYGIGGYTNSIVQGTVTAGGSIDILPLPLSGVGETMILPPSPSNYPHKTLFTFTTSSGRVAAILRYSVPRMRP